MLTIVTPRLRLRLPRTDDVDALVRLLADPAVARWWPGYDAARVRDEFVAVQDDTTVLAIERAGAVIGLVQYAEEEDPQYRHASIDLFLGANAHGRGYGPEVIRAVVRHLVSVRGHHRIVIDSAAANVAAIRAYEKVGFRRIGVMREYERGADGSWHDGVLMELLAREFVDFGGIPERQSSDDP
jgi:aminoglycoside 6'-N-acetyltransferase